MTTRILFLTNRLAPAGAEQFLLARLSVLDRSRFAPVVGELRAGGELKPAFEAAGVRSVTFGAARQFDPSALSRLYEFLRRERVDILEAHVWYACLVARVVGRLARVPVIITNEQDVRMGFNSVRRDLLLLEDLTTRLSSACVHITRASERSFLEGTPRFLQGGVLRRVIPNGIDARLVEGTSRAVDRVAKRQALGLAADDFVIGNVARLQPAKGHVHLLDAFVQVRGAVPRAKLVLVGWGVLEDELRRRVHALGLGDDVIFLGRRLDVHELLATFDLFGFSSVHEGQGIAILEAMAAGVPVVATDVDGIPEMVRHEQTGLLVPARNADALAAALLRLHADPPLGERLVAAARVLVQSDFSVGRIGEEYQRLYAELRPETVL